MQQALLEKITNFFKKKNIKIIATYNSSKGKKNKNIIWKKLDIKKKK